MKTAAVIAELNPFHNGHQYLLDQVRARSGADCIIVIMSGDFTQRGEPAIFDKYVRAETALACGADIVFELPVRYATGGARDFAFGAVSLLDRLNTVDELWFGCESGGTALFEATAALLADEPAAISASVKKSMRSGLAYPAALAAAVTEYASLSRCPSSGAEANVTPPDPACQSERSDTSLSADNPKQNISSLSAGTANKITAPASADMEEQNDAALFASGSEQNVTPLSAGSTIETPPPLSGENAKEVASLLTSPNNILALEYCIALKRLQSRIVPRAVLRKGPAHNSTELSGTFASASLLRSRIMESAPSNRERGSGAAGSRGGADNSCADNMAGAADPSLSGGGSVFTGCSDGKRSSDNSFPTGFRDGKDPVSARILPYIPEKASGVLRRHDAFRCPVSADDFSSMLRYRIMSETAEELEKYDGVGADLARRIKRHEDAFSSFSQFAALIRPKNRTRANINRALLHILLRIKKESAAQAPSFLRILGFRTESAGSLHAISRNSCLKLIPKPSSLPTGSYEPDLFASNLYEAVMSGKYGVPFRHEYTRQIVKI